MPTKVCLVEAIVFPVVMYGCESWTVKNAEHWRIDAFELCYWRRLLRVPWTDKEIQPVNPKGDQSWMFIVRTDGEAEAPIFWPPDVKNWLSEKDPNAGKDWRQEKKGMIEDEMVGWHHWLNAHEFEQAPGVGDGQGSLACCSPWGCRELDTTERLNWTEAKAANGQIQILKRAYPLSLRKSLRFISILGGIIGSQGGDREHSVNCGRESSGN